MIRCSMHTQDRARLADNASLTAFQSCPGRRRTTQFTEEVNFQGFKFTESHGGYVSRMAYLFLHALYTVHVL